MNASIKIVRATCRQALIRMLAVGTVLVLAGCADLNSVYRSESLLDGKAHVISVDAKQRMVLSSVIKTKDSKGTTEMVRFCAESPPDVFTAIASSLGLEGSVSPGAAKDAAVKLASTISENAATIERSQTINILREAMYRNCERYLSGAITDSEFIVQAARDQQMITLVLAIEQITGVARAQSTALTTVAKATAGGASDASMQALDAAYKAVESRRAALAKAKEEAEGDKAPIPKTACAADIDVNSLPAGVSADQAKAKNEKCLAMRDAEQLLKSAETHYAGMKDLAGKLGAVGSDSHGQLVAATLKAAEANKEIAARVVELARLNREFKEIEMTCVVMIRTVPGNQVPPWCSKLAEKLAEEAEARAISNTNKLLADAVEYMSDNATQVWTVLGQGYTPTQLADLVSKAGVTIPEPHLKRLVAANGSLAEFQKAFARLTSAQQLALLDAAMPPDHR